MKAWMRGLTAWIMVGMVLGIVAGQICHAAAATPEQAKAISEGFTVITDIFLRLVKMIIAPLVLATLVAGIAHMNDTAALRSEEHTSELQSLMRISYAVFCLQKKNNKHPNRNTKPH